MHSLLRVDSSFRTAQSHSRRRGGCDEALWPAGAVDRRVRWRDPAAAPARHIDHDTSTACSTAAGARSPAPRAAAVAWEALIAGLLQATERLITVPICNGTRSSVLEAWVDPVSRSGHTSAVDGKNFAGRVPAERATVIPACGLGGKLGAIAPLAAGDTLRACSRPVQQFLGIAGPRVCAAEPLALDADASSRRLAAATTQAEALAPAAGGQ